MILRPLTAFLWLAAGLASAADPRIDAVVALPSEKQRADAFIDLCAADCRALPLEDIERVTDSLKRVDFDHHRKKEDALEGVPLEDLAYTTVGRCSEGVWHFGFCEKLGYYYATVDYRQKVLLAAALPLDRMTWDQVRRLMGPNCAYEPQVHARWQKANAPRLKRKLRARQKAITETIEAGI